MNNICKAICLTCITTVALLVGCATPPAERTTVATAVVQIPDRNPTDGIVSVPNDGIGINPGGFTIINYDRSHVELVFTLYNELDYSSDAIISYKHPMDFQLAKNPGTVRWLEASNYIKTLNDDLTIQGNSIRNVTVELYVPEGVEMPDEWVFWVAYQLEGFKWGNYQSTSLGNFVFFPSFFDTKDSPATITDTRQAMDLYTWGNSAEMMIRAQYDTPPAGPLEGELIYRGYGEQVFKPWLDPNLNKVLDRQYTLFTINDNKPLSDLGGQKLFYRAWIAHRVNGVEDGTWDPIDQTIFIPSAEAKVLVSS